MRKRVPGNTLAETMTICVGNPGQRTLETACIADKLPTGYIYILDQFIGWKQAYPASHV